MQIRELLTGNLGFKLIALIGAIALWFFVSYRGQAETTMEANIDFKNVPVGLEILKHNIKRVNVGVRGHEMILAGLKTSDVWVAIDLANGKKGESIYNFNISDVKSRYNITINRIEPTSIKVYLDESVSRSFRITPRLIGEPAKGYEVKKVSTEPAVVTVEGAKTEMARMSTLITEPVDISGLDSTINQQARLDSNGKNVRIRTHEVLISVIIGKKGK
jgi:YbbR domain-containing protein